MVVETNCAQTKRVNIDHFDMTPTHLHVGSQSKTVEFNTLTVKPLTVLVVEIHHLPSSRG
jgi:hypothetical protein